MNQWMWRTAMVVVLCCVLPGASSARTRGSRFSKPKAWQGEVQRFPAAPAEWPRREVLDLAMRAYRCCRAEGQFDSPILTVIDYSLPSTEKRLGVIDLAKRQVLFHELVAHGQNSGEAYAVDFCNRLESRQAPRTSGRGRPGHARADLRRRNSRSGGARRALRLFRPRAGAGCQ